MKIDQLTTENKELINKLFFEYLSKKNIYLINYVSDSYIGEVSNSFQQQVIDNSVGLSLWYQSELDKISADLDRYKLCVGTLICVDQNLIVLDRITQFDFYKNMVICYGSKPWREITITFESCIFQNIRGIILNDDELIKLKNVLGNTTFQKLDFFEDEMIVAASHASKATKLNMSITRELNFRNAGLYVSNETGDINNILNKSILYAHKNQSSILIFPELIMSNNSFNELTNYLNNICSKDSPLKLVVAGSLYERKDGADAYTNTTHILFNNNGKWDELVHYDKMIPFSGAGVMPGTNVNMQVEDIDITSDVTIIPAKDGIIGVAICRDAMDLLDLHNPVHKYADFIDLLLIISYNNGDSNMFSGTAECLSRWHNCATLYTNSIGEAYSGGGSIDDKLEISFALYPYKNTKSSTSLSGEITYATIPFNGTTQRINNLPYRIVYSKGIKYSSFTTEEIDNHCKIYKMKTKDETAKVALVLDTSNSMTYYNYKDVTVIDSKAFLSCFKSGDSISISNYSTKASTPFPLKTITDDQVINNAVDCVEKLSFTGSSTAIGLGLKAGMDQLKNITGNRGLVLLSDGYQNSGLDPLSLEIAPYPIYACAMGQQANHTLLEKISKNSTGGKYYYAPKAYNMSLIYNDIRGLEPNIFSVVNEVKEVKPLDYCIIPATISEYNEIAQIVVTWTNLKLEYSSGNPDNKHLSISIVRPDNIEVPVVPHFVDKGYVIFYIDKPMVGEWKVQIMQGSTGENTHVTVGVFESPYDSGIVLNVDISENYKLGTPVQVNANVTHGDIEILDLVVNAEIIRPKIDIEGAVVQNMSAIKNMSSSMQGAEPKSEIECLLELDIDSGGTILEHISSIKSFSLDELNNARFFTTIEDTNVLGGYYIKVNAKGISPITNSRFERTKIMGFKI